MIRESCSGETEREGGSEYAGNGAVTKDAGRSDCPGHAKRGAFGDAGGLRNSYDVGSSG